MAATSLSEAFGWGLWWWGRWLLCCEGDRVVQAMMMMMMIREMCDGKPKLTSSNVLPVLERDGDHGKKNISQHRRYIDHRRMADLFLKQAKQYWKTRPGYPQQLFDFIASKTPTHDVVWDVGTGSGQAAVSLASIYKSVIGTDTSKNQLEFAPKLPNVRYECIPPNMSMSELEEKIGTESSVDLVTVAQALHWFDHDAFYNQVKWILKKPNGVFAAWCYTTPKIDDEFDRVFQKFYSESKPYWESERGLVDDKYTGVKFPFDPVDGCDHTGPFEFETKQVMSLKELFTYVRSWSAYQTAKDKGVELLNEGVIEEFRKAWKEDENDEKSVTYPVYLRIGKAGGMVKQQAI